MFIERTNLLIDSHDQNWKATLMKKKNYETNYINTRSIFYHVDFIRQFSPICNLALFLLVIRLFNCTKDVKVEMGYKICIPEIQNFLGYSWQP